MLFVLLTFVPWSGPGRAYRDTKTWLASAARVLDDALGEVGLPSLPPHCPRKADELRATVGRWVELVDDAVAVIERRTLPPPPIWPG